MLNIVISWFKTIAFKVNGKHILSYVQVCSFNLPLSMPVTSAILNSNASLSLSVAATVSNVFSVLN